MCQSIRVRRAESLRPVSSTNAGSCRKNDDLHAQGKCCGCRRRFFQFDPAERFQESLHMTTPKLTSITAFLAAGFLTVTVAKAEVNKAEQIAPDAYFHEGEIKGHGHCNNGWIIFDDYVLVIDGNFPSGTQEIIPEIKAITNKSIGAKHCQTNKVLTHAFFLKQQPDCLTAKEEGNSI